MEQKQLIEMLEIAIELLNENEICSYCRAQFTGDCHLGNSDEYCKEMIFKGLEYEAERRLKDDANNTKQ